MNCAALPTELLESELFGFEKGAFTGAIQHKPGKFEFANHGTMFLDEIGDMSFPLQAKLLQVLQDGEFSRLGGKDDVQVDVRVIAATNRDLETAVAAGTVPRGPLLPPERRHDQPAAAARAARGDSVPHRPLPEEVLGAVQQADRRRSAPSSRAQFMDYDWPGNVRQLENMIKRMVVLGTRGADPQASCSSRRRRSRSAPHVVRVSAPRPVARRRRRRLLRPWRPSPTPLAAPAGGGTPIAAAAAPRRPPRRPGNVSLKDIARTAAREAERELILRMLTRTRWNRKEAAEILGISYKALLYKIKENGLDKAS